MTFTLTRAHLDSLLHPIHAGDLSAFLEAIDPAVEWRAGASDQPGRGHTGVYDKAAWLRHIPPKLAGVFGGPNGLKHADEVVEMLGNKAIIEDVGYGKMVNGEEYKNRHCLIFEFSGETGKIVEVRAYLDTEVLAAAKRANGVPVEDAE